MSATLLFASDVHGILKEVFTGHGHPECMTGASRSSHSNAVEMSCSTDHILGKDSDHISSSPSHTLAVTSIEM